MILPYIDMNQPWVYMCSPSRTPLPLPSPSHPSGSSQCTSPDHPISCIKPGLVIHFTYDILHVSVSFSQIFPPCSSAFSKTSLNIWKFTVHILLKPGLENFEHYFTSVWDECNCVVVWAFFGIAFLWDWNENWPFPVLWPLLSFPNLLAYGVQHFHSIIF